MRIFCTNYFKESFERLKGKKPYRDLEAEIIQYFFGKSVPQLTNGTRLNQIKNKPFIKKRLQGSGGYRVYYLLLIDSEKLYLLFVHPKTGPDGSQNITDESKALIYRHAFEANDGQNHWEMTVKNETQILFKSYP